MIAKGLVIIYVEAGWGGGRGKGERVQAISDWLEGGRGYLTFYKEV